MKLAQETVKLFEDFCECYDYQFYPEYSGRCMWGEKCVGVICDSPVRACIELAGYLFENLEEDELFNALEAMKRVSQDSMGLSAIVYFPNIQWTEDEE